MKLMLIVIIFASMFTSILWSQKKMVETDKAPKPIGPYSQAVLVGNTLYVSGQIAINPDNGELVLCTIEDETNQIMTNIKAIIEKAGFEMSDIVKSTIYLKNMENYPAVNKVYSQYFLGDFPARETVEVSKLPKDVNVEISVIAVKS